MIKLILKGLLVGSIFLIFLLFALFLVLTILGIFSRLIRFIITLLALGTILFFFISLIFVVFSIPFLLIKNKPKIDEYGSYRLGDVKGKEDKKD